MINSNFKKLLFSIYWNNGWLSTPKTLSTDKMNILRDEGLYVDHLVLSHDVVIERLNKVILDFSPAILGDYLLASLSKRILEYRAIVDCYTNISPITPHDHTGNGFCETCGIPNIYNYDFNTTIFTALKFGAGDSFYKMPNVYFLESFGFKQKPMPTMDDIIIIQNILTVIQTIKPNEGATALKDKLRLIIKSNDEERHVFIELLAKMGIIRPFGNFIEKYSKVSTRSNWFGPASIWKGEDSLNKSAIKHYFSEHIRDFDM